MKHVIVTRFNLKWKFTKKKGYDNWIKSRLKLWNTYLLGSLKNQNNDNFTYILAIDSDTNEFAINKISTYVRSIFSRIFMKYKDS